MYRQFPHFIVKDIFLHIHGIIYAKFFYLSLGLERSLLTNQKPIQFGLRTDRNRSFIYNRNIGVLGGCDIFGLDINPYIAV